MIRKFVIVRTYSAGVHCGYLEELTGTVVVLSESRRIWRWEGAFTLNEIALSGCAESSRISAAVPEIYLSQATEVIPCSEKAKANLTRSRNGA